MTFKNTAMVFAGLAIAVGTLTTKVMESNAATKEKVVIGNTTFANVMWFKLDVSLAINPENPAEQNVINDGLNTSECTTGATICEVELDVTDILANDPGYQFYGKTVEDLRIAGAKYTGPDPLSDPIYTYHL